jgi:hypothetical protein
VAREAGGARDGIGGDRRPHNARRFCNVESLLSVVRIRPNPKDELYMKHVL